MSEDTTTDTLQDQWPLDEVVPVFEDGAWVLDIDDLYLEAFDGTGFVQGSWEIHAGQPAYFTTKITNGTPNPAHGVDVQLWIDGTQVGQELIDVIACDGSEWVRLGTDGLEANGTEMSWHTATVKVSVSEQEWGDTERDVQFGVQPSRGNALAGDGTGHAGWVNAKLNIAVHDWSGQPVSAGDAYIELVDDDNNVADVVDKVEGGVIAVPARPVPANGRLKVTINVPGAFVPQFSGLSGASFTVAEGGTVRGKAQQGCAEVELGAAEAKGWAESNGVADSLGVSISIFDGSRELSTEKELNGSVEQSRTVTVRYPVETMEISFDG